MLKKLKQIRKSFSRICNKLVSRIYNLIAFIGNVLSRIGKKVSRVSKQILYGSADKPMIYALIDRWGTSRKQVVSVALFLVLFTLFGWSFTLTIAMLVSMYLHEMGHAAHFVINQIKCKLLYLFPMGAVAAPSTDEEDKKSDLLPWNRIAHLLQAGPMVNVALMTIAALLIPYLDGSLQQFARDMIYVNALLAFSNLIPIWKLDAGQLYKLIYSSLQEKHEKFVAIPFLLLPLAFTVWYLFGSEAHEWWQVLGRFLDQAGLLIVLVSVGFSIWFSQHKDKPEHADSSQAMTAPQLFIQIMIYWIQILLALLIMTQANLM